MNILVSNDDGIEARGLRVLVDALASLPENRIYVWAPDGERSATSHGISTGVPIMLNDVEYPGAEEAHTLSGNPADCVKVGIRRLQRESGITIDAVFSGINHGGNLGTDVFYSGTVAAAAEGVLNGVRSVSVSVGARYPSDAMLENCTGLIRDICRKALPEMSPHTLLNVNLPNCEPEEIRGLKVARLGPREYNEVFDVLKNPRGRKYFWYSGKEVVYEGLPEDLDTVASQNRYATVTPLKLDLTDTALLEKVGSWDLKL